VDVEIGGNDQTFNMLAGRHLSEKLIHKDKSVVAMKLLVDNSGKKMGKTEGNMISFLDNPKDMFGKVMSWSDEMIMNGFDLCTDITPEEIQSFEKEIKEGKNPMELKKILAYEIVKVFYGDKKATEAKEGFANTFQKGEIPEEMTEIKLNKENETIMDLLVSSKILSSKGEWRRLVAENAVTDLDNDIKITDVNIKPKTGMRFKIGKKRFIKIV
jgi:tyrosyl-tRNA synthetase